MYERFFVIYCACRLLYWVGSFRGARFLPYVGCYLRGWDLSEAPPFLAFRARSSFFVYGMRGCCFRR